LLRLSSFKLPPLLVTVVKPDTSSPMPELSIYETSPRLSRIFFWFLPTNSRRASRSALDPSPRVIRPATSITVTSPTCRVLNFTLTEYASWLNTADLFGHQILDQSYFDPAGLQMPQLAVVHQGSNQENSPA